MQKIKSCLRNYTARGSFEVKNVKVLFIDDKQVDYSIERDLKYLYGINSDVHSSTFDVLGKIAENRYDIIFIDYSITNNNFENMTRQIRELADRYQKMANYFISVPIIILVSENAMGGHRIVLGEGIDDFVPRPVELFYIERIVKKWLPATKRVAIKERESFAKSREVHIATNELEDEPGYYEDIIVPGINMEKCMKVCDFSKTKFLIFLAEAYKKRMTDLELIESYIKKGDIANYTEQVTKLKEFAKGIGCESLYEMAKTQEIAAYSGNYEYVLERAGNLLENFYKLVSDMGDVLTRNHSNHAQVKEDEKLPISYIEFQNEIFNIFMYMDNIRPYTAIKAINRVLGCKISRGASNKLKKVVECIDNMDYEQAMLYLTQIIRGQEMSV